MSATKEAIAIYPTPANFIDIKTVPVEQDQPCRLASTLDFIGPNGVFTSVNKSSIKVTIRGILTEVIILDLPVNVNKVRFGLDNKPPGCTKDEVLYLAANSVNVQTVADPEYLKVNADVVTNVKVFFTRTNKNQPATLGLRAKFEEGVPVGQFNPKRKSGTVTFP